jgi:hypothetical protein
VKMLLLKAENPWHHKSVTDAGVQGVKRLWVILIC